MTPPQSVPSNSRLLIILLGLGAVLFLPFLGSANLFDWDEIMFSEFAREMMLLGDYTRIYEDFKPFHEKPPGFMWLQILSYKLFGVSNFAARFPNAVAGLLTLTLVFRIGSRMISPLFGFIWGMAWLGSFLPHFYFKSAIIDPWFNLTIFTGFYLFFRYAQTRKLWPYLIGAGVSIGLALMVKGPVGYLLPMLAFGVLWVLNKFRFYVPWWSFVVFTGFTFGVGAIWYGIEYALHGSYFIEQFLSYQLDLLLHPEASDHKGFIGFHGVVVLLGCFPASILALPAFGKWIKAPSDESAQFKRWLIVLFWVVMVVFSLVVTKIVHYSSLTYYPITFLAALTGLALLQNRWSIRRWQMGMLVAIGGLIALVIIALPIVVQFKDLFRQSIKDPFARENLAADVVWTGFEGIGGVLLIVGMVLFIFFLKQKNPLAAVLGLFWGTALCIFVTLVLVVPNVEGYTQRASVEFFQSLAGKDVYLKNLRYRTYVHLFYGQYRRPDNPNYYRKDCERWLLEGEIDKDAYFVCKIQDEHHYKDVSTLKKLYDKNGFVFFYRPAFSPQLP